MVIVSGNLNLSKLSCTDSFYRSSVPNNQIEMRFFALYSRRRVHKPAYLDSFVKVIFRGDTCPQSYGLQNNARRQRNAILQFVARNNTSEDCTHLPDGRFLFLIEQEIQLCVLVISPNRIEKNQTTQIQ